MAKLKLIIIAVVACILAASVAANVILFKENSRKNKEIKEIGASLQSLSDSFSEISKMKTVKELHSMSGHIGSTPVRESLKNERL